MGQGKIFYSFKYILGSVYEFDLRCLFILPLIIDSDEVWQSLSPTIPSKEHPSLHRNPDLIEMQELEAPE